MCRIYLPIQNIFPQVASDATFPIQGRSLDFIFSAVGHDVSQGLRTSTSSPSKSPIFRVAIDRL